MSDYIRTLLNGFLIGFGCGMIFVSVLVVIFGCG